MRASAKPCWGPARNPHRVLSAASGNIGALIVRIGLWGPLCHKCSKLACRCVCVYVSRHVCNPIPRNLTSNNKGPLQTEGRRIHDVLPYSLSFKACSPPQPYQKHKPSPTSQKKKKRTGKSGSENPKAPPPSQNKKQTSQETSQQTNEHTHTHPKTLPLLKAP